MTTIPTGEYEHFKGKRYTVLGVARHSEILEDMVIYQALYGDHETWVRPLRIFLEEVEHDDKKIPRFKYLGN